VEDLGRLLPELRKQPHPITRDKAAATGFHH
jgi:glutamate decarboxylase